MSGDAEMQNAPPVACNRIVGMMKVDRHNVLDVILRKGPPAL
jgi:hypothetical protein